MMWGVPIALLILAQQGRCSTMAGSIQTLCQQFAAPYVALYM